MIQNRLSSIHNPLIWLHISLMLNLLHKCINLRQFLKTKSDNLACYFNLTDRFKADFDLTQ